MDRFPCLTINKEKLAHNTRKVIGMCAKKNIKVVAITKLFQADPEIAQLMVENGIEFLGDARIQNLIKLKDVNAQKILIRIPMLNEIDQLVEYSDISLNSEIETIKAISEYCVKHSKTHKVVLMVDMGDRREGVNENEVMSTVDEIIKMKNIELCGIGVNYGCFGGVIPSVESMGDFINHANQIEEKYGIKLNHISGGSSLHLHMIWENTIPDKVTHLRIGQSIHLGVEDKYGEIIDGLYGDIYKIHAQVVEKKTKPSVPKGEIGIDAFGNVPVFKERGDLKRIILGIGKQDILLGGLYPEDNEIEIMGGSSDHTILNISNCKNNYKIGDVLSFDVNYSTLLSAFNSDYVYKKIV